MNRRTFLHTASAATLALTARPAFAASAVGTRVATNTYPWEMFARRDDGSFILHTDAALAAIASTGISGYEPNMRSPDAFDGLAGRLKAHRLDMRSLYVNSTLHDETASAASVAEVLAIGRRAKELGTRIVVTNAAPIKWGGPENKTDAQLCHQAARLNELGASLPQLGLTLAYHNHDAELRLGGREFHHMLTATDPKHVKFCLDAHWIYRGCGDSQAALFDALEHYGDRIVELHLRQSQGGVWTEVFTAAGDIDYARLADWLRQRRMKPHLVLEQAVEKGSPKSLDVVEAHRRSLTNTRALFHDFD
jgi:inosose dehydratase